MEIKKGAKDSNGVSSCWSGYHAAGTKKGRNGGQVRNCVPNEGVEEGAPELLKKEMPLHRHAEKLLAHNGVSKDDPDYHHHRNNTIKHLRQFGNIDLINKSDEQGVAEAGSAAQQAAIAINMKKHHNKPKESIDEAIDNYLLDLADAGYDIVFEGTQP